MSTAVDLVSHTLLSTSGSTRATLYNWTSKILTHEGRTFVTWQDYLAANQIKTLDRATGDWSDTDTVGCGVDNHCGPALAMDSSGYLHVVTGSHGFSPFQHRRSRDPMDQSEWQHYRPVGDGPTYPSLVCDRDDQLHLAYRGCASKVEWMEHAPASHLMYQRARAEGGDWLPAAELVRTEEPYGYTQYGNSLCIDRRNRIHMVFHMIEGHPVERGLRVGYLRSESAGSTWTRSDGEQVPIPTGKNTFEVLEEVEQGYIRVTNVACDSSDRPYTIVVDREDGDALLLWHDGRCWNRRLLLEEVRQVRPEGFIAADGTLTFDRHGGLYIALQTSAKVGDWGSDGAEVVLLFSEDGGRNFSASQISRRGDRLPCWQPSLEMVSSFHQEAPEAPALTWTRGFRGTGCFSRDYSEVHFAILQRRN